MSFLVLLWLYCLNTIITTNGCIKFPFKSIHLQSKVSLFHSLLELKVLQSSVANKHDVLMRETAKIKKEIQEFQMTLAADKQAAHHESEKQQSIIRAFDLIRMYRFYYAVDIVGGNWEDFCEKYYEFEDEIFEGKRTQAEFDAYLKPFNDQLVSGLTFAQIIKITYERQNITHINCAAKQQAFLKECSEVVFADFQSNLIAAKILPELQHVSLKRMK